MSFLATVPVLAALSAAPAGAQVSARLHLDIPIGRRAPVIYGAPRRQVIVRQYDPYLFGSWDSYYDDWDPVTLYYYDGYYYDYPIVEYAEPILVYSFRGQYFFPPRDRGFDVWRREYRGSGFSRGFDRDDRGIRSRPRDPRDAREFRSAPRDGREFQPAPRDGRQFQPGPRQYQGAPRDGGQFQPGPRQYQGAPRDGRQFQPGPRQNQPAPQDRGNGRNGNGHQGGDHGNGRSRPRP